MKIIVAIACAAFLLAGCAGATSSASEPGVTNQTASIASAPVSSALGQPSPSAAPSALPEPTATTVPAAPTPNIAATVDAAVRATVQAVIWQTPTIAAPISSPTPVNSMQRYITENVSTPYAYLALLQWTETDHILKGQARDLIHQVLNGQPTILSSTLGLDGTHYGQTITLNFVPEGENFMFCLGPISGSLSGDRLLVNFVQGDPGTCSNITFRAASEEQFAALANTFKEDVDKAQHGSS